MLVTLTLLEMTQGTPRIFMWVGFWKGFADHNIFISMRIDYLYYMSLYLDDMMMFPKSSTIFIWIAGKFRENIQITTTLILIMFLES